jgi:uncharacterized small protein (DUF1192 family)
MIRQTIKNAVTLGAALAIGAGIYGSAASASSNLHIPLRVVRLEHRVAILQQQVAELNASRQQQEQWNGAIGTQVAHLKADTCDLQGLTIGLPATVALGQPWQAQIDNNCAP